MSIPTIGSSAYKAWVDAQAASRIVIVELQPGEVLTTWAATGGATPNVYETAFSTFAATSKIPAGLYRRLDGVEENGVALTNRASLALVNSNAGSWRYENGKIYVRTTATSNPTVLASVVAVFTIFVATEPLDFLGGELYEGRISGQLPQVEATVDTLYGARILSTGDVALPNGDGLFDALSKQWVWHGRYAQIRLGGRELALADFENVARMVVDRVLPNDAECRIILRDQQDALEQWLPPRTISVLDYAMAGTQEPGTRIPLLYGEVRSIAPPLVDATPGASVYLLSDPLYTTLQRVTNVSTTDPTGEGSIGLSEGVDYTVNLVACTVTLTRADLINQTIVCDAVGPAAVATMPDLVVELLTILGVAAGDIDSTSFDDAAANHEEPFGIWIRDGAPASEYITRIEASMVAALLRGRDGKWILLTDEIDEDLDESPEFFDEDLSAWTPTSDDSDQISEVRVSFDERYWSGTFEEASHSDDSTRYNEKSPSSWTVTSILRDRADAHRLAQLYLLRMKNRPVPIDISENGLTLMTQLPFTLIRVTRDRAPSTEGFYDRRVLFVKRLAKQLSPPRVDATILDRPDMVALYARVKAWSSDSIDTWAGASAAERDANAFWHDDSDTVTTGVTNHSAWI